jgi:Mrp family chromosome partitioning ATPase
MSKMMRRNSPASRLNHARAPLLFLEALRWRKGTIFTWIVIGLALATAALLLARPHYTATAEVLLGVGSVGAAVDNAALAENQIEVLKSSSLAEAVIDKRGLWKDPEFACGSRGPLRRVLDVIRGRCWRSPLTSVDRDTIVANFQDATRVERSGHSFVVDVSFTSIDPQKAAATANALASAYVGYQSTVQTRDIEQAGARVADHIAHLREKSDAALAAVDKNKSSDDAHNHGLAGNQARALESQSQAYRLIYRTLLDRYAQSVSEQAYPVTEARIISYAEPPSHRSTPNVPFVLLLGAGMGLLVGMAVATRNEHVARPVRSLEQIERDIGVPALGIVPLVQGRRLLPDLHQAPPLLLHDRCDALRGIKIAVNELCARDARVIGIVSAYQGEGKSTVAFNLAVLEVESRRSVLLVDANLHRPSLGLSLPHGTLLPPLEGRAALSDVVTRSELGFDFLGERSAELPVHPADLLASHAMRDLIRAARDRYDCVVCDLPNVLGHADVQAAADLFDALVMVTEWGRTPSAAATRAALKSAVISDRLVGVIINKAPPGHSALA